MFISKKNRQYINYQDSYFYRDQRKKRRSKWLKHALVLFFIILLTLFFVPFAQSNQLYFNQQLKSNNALIKGSPLLFKYKTPPMCATLPIDIMDTDR